MDAKNKKEIPAMSTTIARTLSALPRRTSDQDHDATAMMRAGKAADLWGMACRLLQGFAAGIALRGRPQQM
jgi:hypothetical protein